MKFKERIVIINSYWYERQPVPEEIKTELNEMTVGEKVQKLCFDNGMTLSLVKVNGTVFKEIFTLNREYLYMGDHTAPPAENDYIHSNCYVVENGLAGFAITKDKWLVSLFSNLEVRGLLPCIKSIIRQQATKLVCVMSGDYRDSKLVTSYMENLNFMPFAKTRNDTQIMCKYYGTDFVNTFQQHYGNPYHLFMVNQSMYKSNSNIYVLDDYFDTENFVARSLYTNDSK